MALDVLAFSVASAITLAGAVMVLQAEEIFHSALYLALSLLGVASLFLMLNAEFVAIIQVMVYAGGVVVLVLFAIMLTRRPEYERFK